MTDLNDNLKAIDELTGELYGCISFLEGDKPQLERLRELLLKEARMINTDPEIPVNLGVEEFIESFNEALTVGGLKEFNEKEIFHKTDIFGRIAHRFSTYEARFDAESMAPAAVGINSIQFVKTDEGWKVSGMCWFNQKENLPIPRKYLNE